MAMVWRQLVDAAVALTRAADVEMWSMTFVRSSTWMGSMFSSAFSHRLPS